MKNEVTAVDRPSVQWLDCPKPWTPWGRADYKQSYGKGITFYGTPSHGGFRVSDGLNAQIPSHVRQSRGWYEEDCEWAIVAAVFPDRFTQDEQESATATLKNYHPDFYEELTGETIALGESYSRDEKLFHETHANDWVAVAAWGDWHERVPLGMVGVCATLGGARSGVKRYFLVPASDYAPGKFGFVIPSEALEMSGLWTQ